MSAALVTYLVPSVKPAEKYPNIPKTVIVSSARPAGRCEEQRSRCFILLSFNHPQYLKKLAKSVYIQSAIHDGISAPSWAMMYFPCRQRFPSLSLRRMSALCSMGPLSYACSLLSRMRGRLLLRCTFFHAYKVTFPRFCALSHLSTRAIFCHS